MKRTHKSVGVWDSRFAKREKHRTLCGSICDNTKATTHDVKVTCRNCQAKLFGRTPTDQEWFEYLKAKATPRDSGGQL